MEATIVGTGRIAGADQEATLRYLDRSGQAHLVRVLMSRNGWSSLQRGLATMVAYDPTSPGQAEIAYHPRVVWQDAARAIALVLALTGAWLGWLARLRYLARKTPTPVRRVRVYSLATLAGLCLVIGRLGVALAASVPIQIDPFDPTPPPSTAAAAPLPAILSAAPHVAPLVTPAQSRAIFAAVWPVRDKALAHRNAATVRQLETGPALLGDISRMSNGGSPDRPVPDRSAPATFQTYVPRQNHWPIRFLGEAVTTSAGQPFLEMLVFVRDSPASHWKAAYDTGFSQATGPPLQPDQGILDSQGYDVIPHPDAIPAGKAVPALASYWQAWLDLGHPPTTGPGFEPTHWTTGFGTTYAGDQGKRDSNGLPVEITYGDPATPTSQVWTFGIDGNYELVFSPLYETKTWTGPAYQDPHRENWGTQLAPGTYAWIRSETLREPAFLIPPPGGKLLAAGADPWALGETGQRSST